MPDLAPFIAATFLIFLVGFSDPTSGDVGSATTLQRSGGLEAHFDATSGAAFEVAGGFAFGLELLGAWRDGRAFGGTAELRANGGRVELHRGAGLVEWWDEHALVFEHGFDLAQRPPGRGELDCVLRARGSVPRPRDGARGVTFHATSGVRVLDDVGLVTFDADGNELPAQLAIVHQGLAIPVDDTDARYPLGESSASTGMDGNQSNQGPPASGAPYVFVRSGTSWTEQAYLKASNRSVSDFRGWSLGLDGDVLAVSAVYQDCSATGIEPMP